jgi:hypothetical protein
MIADEPRNSNSKAIGRYAKQKLISHTEVVVVNDLEIIRPP